MRALSHLVAAPGQIPGAAFFPTTGLPKTQPGPFGAKTSLLNGFHGCIAFQSHPGRAGSIATDDFDLMLATANRYVLRPLSVLFGDYQHIPIASNQDQLEPPFTSLQVVLDMQNAWRLRLDSPDGMLAAPA